MLDPHPGLSTASSFSEVGGERLSPKAEFSPLPMSLKSLPWPGGSGPVLLILWELSPGSHTVLVLVLERRLECLATGSLLTHGRASSHGLSSGPRGRGARDGAEGGVISRDAVFMVAFRNDGSCSRETRSMGRR